MGVLESYPPLGDPSRTGSPLSSADALFLGELEEGDSQGEDSQAACQGYLYPELKPCSKGSLQTFAPVMHVYSAGVCFHKFPI